MTNHLFHNTWKLTGFILRRDRIRIPIWIISLCAVTLLTAISLTDLYPTAQDRQGIAETMLNPAMTAMVGPGYGLENYTPGAMMAHQMLLFTALVVGIMFILLVARHTRADEEDGRIEMIRSLPTGRLAHLHATILVMLGTNVALALITGFGLYALGIESMDLEGSLIYGVALGAAGFIFAAITALFAQLSENSRNTIGFSLAILGFSYLLRAIGDVGNETLSWFSPLGMVIGAEVYVHNYWWPILLTLGIAMVIVILAYYLNAIRDLDAGFLPSKPGRKHASIYLQSPLGLSLRLQRTGIMSWAIGMFILGASYGSVLGDLESFFADNEMMKDMLTVVEGFSLTEQFITMIMSIMAMICTIPALMAMLKLIGEERKNRTEHLLGRAVSRARLMGSSLFISLAVSFVMVSLAAIGLGTVGNAVMADSISLSTFYSAAMAYWPAMWIMTAIALLLVGIAPRLTGLIWLYLLYSFVVVYIGGILQLPEWMSKLSPYGHIPRLPVEDMDIMKLFTLTIIAIVITVAGFSGYRQRDIQG